MSETHPCLCGTLRQQHENLFEMLPQTVVYHAQLNDTSTTTYVSSKVEDILGFSPEDYAADPELWIDHIHPEDKAGVLEKLHESQATNTTFSAEYRFIRKDGTTIWLYDTADIVRDHDGNPLYLLGLNTDITARKSSELALQRRDKILQAVSEISAWPVEALDKLQQQYSCILQSLGKAAEVSGVFLFQNSKTPDNRLLTSRIAQWRSKTGYLSGPDDKFSIRDADYESYGMGRWRNTLANGKLIWGKIDGFPRSEQQFLLHLGIKSLAVAPVFVDGNWDGFIGFEDCREYRTWSQAELEALKSVANAIGGILQRNETSRRLKESEKHFTDLFLNMNEGVALHELVYNGSEQPVDYRILDVNPAYERILGISSTEAKATLGSELYGVTPAPYLEQFASVAESGTPQILELHFKPMDKHFQVSVFRPAPNQFATVFSDISERVRYTQELKQAKSEAEAASRAKTDFLASVSHELKTPLNPIIGMTEIFLSQAKASDELEIIEIVQKSAFRLENIINNMLEYANLDRGTTEQYHEVFSPLRVVDTEIGYARGTAPDLKYDIQNGINGKAAPLPRNLNVISDELALRKVLRHLLDNAIKFSGKGSITARVGKLPDVACQPDSVNLRFEVIDEGIGIKECLKEHIFKPLTQGNSSASREYEGIGLGLPICQKLIELLGGTIGFNSEPGKGSCFWFEASFKLEKAF